MPFELNSVRDVWSAAPTPFGRDGDLDAPAIKRMVEHHVRLGVKGLSLGGLRSEGPWMTDYQRRLMVRSVVAAGRGRLPVSVHVTDNSTARIVANMKAAREDGADVAVIGAPYFLVNETPETVRDMVLDAIRASPLPVGLADLGKDNPKILSIKTLKAVLNEKNVILVQDQSDDAERQALFLASRRKRRDLRLLSSQEFDCVSAIKAGYDGLILGGGVINAYLARQIIEAVRKGDLVLAQQLQHRMNRMMQAVYGGRNVTCRFSGEKRLLMELGVFSTWHNLLRYPLTPACERAILRVVKMDRAWLLPE